MTREAGVHDPETVTRSWLTSDPMGVSGDCSHARNDLTEARQFVWQHWQDRAHVTAVISTTHWDGSQLLRAVLYLTIEPCGDGDRQLSSELHQNGVLVERSVFTRVRKARGRREVCNAETFSTPYYLVFEGKGDEQSL